METGPSMPNGKIKKGSFAVVATACALCAAQTAEAQSDQFYYSGTSGSVMMKVCPAIWKPGNFDPCGAYIMGVIDGLSVSKQICPTAGVVNMQLAQLAYNAVKEHPEIWNEPAILIIKRDLTLRYPCGRSGPATAGRPDRRQ